MTVAVIIEYVKIQTAPYNGNVMMKIVHVCSEKTSKGARVKAQIELFDASLITFKSALPNMSLIKRLMKISCTHIVFHEQDSLFFALVFFIIKKASNNNVKIIYDIHDLHRLKPNAKRNARICYLPFLVIERFFVKNFESITVSKGLSRELKNKFGTDVPVFYNASSADIDKMSFDNDAYARGNKVLYFGLISPLRISVDDVNFLSSTGLTVSVAGREVPGVKREYFEELYEAVRLSGGSILGPYSPNDLRFIKKYDYSLMLFNEESPNIKYCMPNKLFQTLVEGRVLIVGNNLHEVLEEFHDTGYVISSDEFVRGDVINQDHEKLKIKLRDISAHNFKVLSKLLA